MTGDLTHAIQIRARPMLGPIERWETSAGGPQRPPRRWPVAGAWASGAGTTTPTLEQKGIAVSASRHSLGRQFRVLLLVAGLAAACATAVMAVAPALATNESYGCPSCFSTNGSENYVKNNEGINYSNTGSCSNVWRNNGGGSYTLMAHGCISGGGTSWGCSEKEVYGHGEVEFAESGPARIGGRQDNFKYCG